MPYKSLAQRGFLHAHPQKLGKEGLKEWDAATKGKHLPEHVKVYDEGGVVAQKDKKMNPFAKITGGDAKPKKELHKITTHKAHSGGYVHTHQHHHPEHHPDETHISKSMADVHKHMDDHMGTPAEGEEAPSGPSAPAPMTAAPSPMASPAAPAGAGAPPTGM